MKLHIEVTQEDIDQGCRNDTTGEIGGCMVHRAFVRATEGAFSLVDVQHCEISVWRADELAGPVAVLDYPMTDEDENWIGERIYDFDHGRHVEPFAFDLELPDNLLAGDHR